MEADLVLDAGADDLLTIPQGAALLEADFDRSGPDLLLTLPDGMRIVVADYFAVENPPTLATEGGAIIQPELVASLAGPLAPGQYAQVGDLLAPQVIGRVDTITGDVTASRADGTTVTLTQGADVFMGDVVATADSAAVGLVFLDESAFSLGEDGRMVLDELIYDPVTAEGSSAFSILQGVFVFVSGEIAASNPDGMLITTPVAVIGIRGTKVGGRAAQEGEYNTVTLMPQQGMGSDGQVIDYVGTITVENWSGAVTLTSAYETTALASVFEAPIAPVMLSMDQATLLYQSVERWLPDPANPAANTDRNEGADDVAFDTEAVAGSEDGVEGGGPAEDADGDGEPGTAEGELEADVDALLEGEIELEEEIGAEPGLEGDMEAEADAEAPGTMPGDAPVEEGIAADGPVDEGPMGEGPMGEGPMGEGPMGEGPMSEGPMGEGPMSEGPMGEGPMSEGPMSEGPMSEGPMSEGPMGEGPMGTDSAVMTTAGMAIEQAAWATFTDAVAGGEGIDSAMMAAETVALDVASTFGFSMEDMYTGPMDSGMMAGEALGAAFTGSVGSPLAGDESISSFGLDGPAEFGGESRTESGPKGPGELGPEGPAELDLEGPGELGPEGPAELGLEGPGELGPEGAATLGLEGPGELGPKGPTGSASGGLADDPGDGGKLADDPFSTGPSVIDSGFGAGSSTSTGPSVIDSGFGVGFAAFDSFVPESLSGSVPVGTPQSTFGDTESSDPIIVAPPINRPPSIIDGPLATNEDAAISKSFTLWTTDPDNNPLTFAVVAQPSNGTVSQASTGSADFTYTPSANFSGTDTFTFKANDGITDSATATVTVTVSPVNDTPSVINGPISTNEDTAKSEAFTTWTTDADGNDLTFTVVSQPSNGTVSQASTGSAGFSYTPSANFTGTDAFTFKANDGTVDSSTATVTVTVAAVNDVPVVSGAGATLAYTENASATTIDPNFTLSDVDSDTLNGATVTISENYISGEDVLGFGIQATIPGVLNWDASTGVMTWDGTTTKALYERTLESMTYQNTSDNPSTLPRTITYQVNDGSSANNLSSVVTNTVTVAAVNDVPVVSGTGATLAYTENASATVIDSSLTLSDVDSNNLTGATVTISGNFQSGGEDVLAFTAANGSGITGSFNNSTGVLTLSGTTTKALYEQTLESVTYQNTSDNPSTSARTITWQVNDGSNANNLSSAVTSTVTVAAVNDVPVITSASSQNVAENTTAVMTVTATDAENNNVAYSLTGGADQAKFSINSSSGALTFSSAPDFESPTDSGSNNTYVVQVTASDGNGGTAAQTITATVTDVSDTFGKALIFDGSNDHVEISDNNLLDLAGDHTLETWFRHDGASGYRVILSKYSGSWPPNYMLYLDGGDIDFYNGATISGPSISANEWTHVAIVRDASSGITMYVNGSSVATGGAGSSPANSGKLYIGSRGDTYHFDGMLDEVRIWNDVRTATEISDNYKTPLSGSEANLVAYYKFDDNLNDSSGNNLHGTGSGDIGTYSESTATAGDPLVFDLDGDGVELLGLDAGVTFDLFGSPEHENTGWVGPNDALLAMDLDGSGAIESLTEIFSDRFGGISFPSSLDALRSLDANADGVIDTSDPSFGDILLWQDADSDGLSSKEELRTLTDHGITAIDLDPDAMSESMFGNRIDATGGFEFSDGSRGIYAQVTFSVSENVSSQDLSETSITIVSKENDKDGDADYNDEAHSVLDNLAGYTVVATSNTSITAGDIEIVSAL